MDSYYQSLYQAYQSSGKYTQLQLKELEMVMYMQRISINLLELKPQQQVHMHSIVIQMVSCENHQWQI